MAIKRFEDNSPASTSKPTTTDHSNLVDGLNPFRESMGAGNMLADKGPEQLQGSDNEQTSASGLDPKKVSKATSLGGKN